MNTENLLAAIGNLDPRGLWSRVGGIFGMMEICEDEIAKAQARHPEHEKIVWRDGFKLLCPSTYLNGVPEPIYRAHCAELLDRVAYGFDTTLGTKAEIMMGLSRTSLKVPLMHTAAVLYARIFRGIYPNIPLEDGIRQLADMDFDGTTGTLLAEISKKCRDPGRKLPHTRGE